MASRPVVKSENLNEDGLRNNSNSPARTVNDSDFPPFLRFVLPLLRLAQDLTARAFSFFASRLAPVAIFISLIPVLLLLSLIAGLYVWKTIAVGWTVPLYLQYGDGTSPYAEVVLPGLSPYQSYDFSLHLAVPTSETNYALGNFMTSLTLTTPSNRSLTSVRKPAIILRPTKSHLRFWSSTPLLLDLEVPLLDSFVPGTSQVVARVEVGRRDEWTNLGRGEGRELTVITTNLRGTVRRKGLRGLIASYPIMFSLASSMAFMTVSTLILIASMLPAMQKRLVADGAIALPAETQQKEERSPKPARRRALSRDQARRRSRSVDPKAEESVEIPPASGTTSTTLRRRRSGLLFTES